MNNDNFQKNHLETDNSQEKTPEINHDYIDFTNDNMNEEFLLDNLYTNYDNNYLNFKTSQETKPFDFSKINIGKNKTLKHFNESLKTTFSEKYRKENKNDWIKIIKIFSILDTYHLLHLINIYRKNVFTRQYKINNYLKNIKKYNEKNCNYYIIALQNFLD